MTGTSPDFPAIADRYRRLSERFAEILVALEADHWSARSRCDEWTVSEVVDHVVGTTIDYVGRFGVAVDAAEEASPTERFDAVRATVQSRLDDPEAAASPYESMFGPSTFAETLDGFYSMDLAVHAWDIAAAIGLDDHTTIDPADITAGRAALAGVDADVMRMPGLFGPEIAVADEADEQTRFLGWIGRSSIGA